VTTPAVPDFIPGYGPQQSDMQTLWVNPATFFRTRVVFRATQATTATTIPDSGAYTTIAYDNILEDPYSGWSASAHKWTAPAGYSGWYLATMCVFIASAANNDILAANIGGSPQVEPAAASAQSNAAGGAVAANYAYLTGGQDALWGTAALLNASASVSTSLTAGEQSSLEIIWISS
jgi:hypothetical protein